MKKDMSLVILAAGMGSRYGGLKQVDPVGPSGEIIIDYSVYDALKAGINKLVFVIRHDIEEDFRKSIGKKHENIADVHYVFQELDAVPSYFQIPPERKKPWGTGHAILQTEKSVNEPFAVINSDDYYGPSAYKMLSDFFSETKNENLSPEEYAMVGFKLKNTLSDFGTVSRGVCEVSEDNFLINVEEIKDISKTEDGASYMNSHGVKSFFTGNEIVSMNMWGFNTSIFSYLNAQFEEFLKSEGGGLKSEFFIPSVVDRLLNEEKVRAKVLKSNDRWFGVTYKEDKVHVQKSIRRLIAEGIYPESLFN